MSSSVYLYQMPKLQKICAKGSKCYYKKKGICKYFHPEIFVANFIKQCPARCKYDDKCTDRSCKFYHDKPKTL